MSLHCQDCGKREKRLLFSEKKETYINKMRIPCKMGDAGYCQIKLPSSDEVDRAQAVVTDNGFTISIEYTQKQGIPYINRRAGERYQESLHFSTGGNISGPNGYVSVWSPSFGFYHLKGWRPLILEKYLQTIDSKLEGLDNRLPGLLREYKQSCVARENITFFHYQEMILSRQRERNSLRP